ncbi:hypothetical protein BHE74_00025819 [Ensete ventricosum]|nr:hypothetical protein BHE74_00025819 [Ensete ventricosum]
MNLQQRGGLGGAVDTVSSEPNPLSAFTSSSGQSQGQQQQCFQNPSGSQLGPDRPQSQIDAVQNFQQQFSVPQSQQQQLLLRGGFGNVGHMGPVKLEPQMGPVKLEPQIGPSNQIGPSQQLQMLRGTGAVKMEPQQMCGTARYATINLDVVLISEVVNSMKDLIDYSKQTEAGPIDCLSNFPRRTSTSSGLQAEQARQPDQQQPITHNSNHNDQGSAHAPSVPLSAGSNNVVGVDNSLNAASSTSASTIIGILHQNSTNIRQENQMNIVNSPFGGNNVQIPSASSSNSLAPTQSNPPLKPASGDNPTPTSHNATYVSSTNSSASLSTMQQPVARLHETDPSDSQSSVQKILQELMSSQLNGVSSLGNETKMISGVTPALNGGNCLVGNGISNDSAISGTGFTGLGGIGLSGAASGMRAAMTNNAMAMNGRIGMNHLSQDPTAMNRQQQDIGNRLLDRLGAVTNFNNLQFDWKSSP